MLVLIVPVLAKQDSANEEDQYRLKEEWKNKHVVKEQYGELTHMVFLLIDTGEPGNGYELEDYTWFTLPVKYTINPSTPVKNYRLTPSQVVQAVENSFESWDAESSKDLFDPPLQNTRAKASLANPDRKNVVTWGRLSDKNVVALTSIWYYTTTKEIIDADMVFNTYYKWGIDKDGEGTQNTLPAAFDIQNIGTHEAGHVCSLADLYDPAYSAMTMFGYASYGEVNKISLEKGDIAGLRAIYP
jgi:hypothetical protein